MGLFDRRGCPVVALVLAAALAGCGDSAEVKAAKAAQKAEADRVQQLTARIEQRHAGDCDAIFKAAHAAEAAEAMGKALRQLELWEKAHDARQSAQAKFDACMQDSRSTKRAELAAVTDWGQNQQAILARASTLVASKDWRGLKSLASRYEVNGDPRIDALRATAAKLEHDYDVEFMARHDLDEFHRRSRDMGVYQVLVDLALAVPAGTQGAPQMQPAARCLAAAGQVQAEELKTWQANGGTAPDGRSIPELYDTAQKTCAKEAETVCAAAGAPASCAAPRDEPLVPLAPAPLVSDEDWHACDASTDCNDTLGLADRYCAAYLDHSRDFRAAALQGVYAASQVGRKATEAHGADVVGQMSVVGRQVGASLGATMWRQPLDANATFKACDTAMRRHPATPKLLAALLPKAAAAAAAAASR